MTRDPTKQLPPGDWLIHDPQDADFAIWRRAHPTSDPIVLVDWNGALDSTRTVVGPPNERFIWVVLTQAQVEELQLAAAHGVFHRIARPLWQRIMA